MNRPTVHIVIICLNADCAMPRQSHRENSFNHGRVRGDKDGELNMLDDRLKLSTRFAFGAGGIPETLKNSVWDMFVLFYFTQVLGLPGSLAGIAIAITLTVNALVDPSIGSYSDAMPVRRLDRKSVV